MIINVSDTKAKIEIKPVSHGPLWNLRRNGTENQLPFAFQMLSLHESSEYTPGRIHPGELLRFQLVL